ncbi:unnamed protein product [Clavelina lepadiformis]|uniref:Alpha-(1,6)-fucosyltransferase n=2 Tax=Clavelina lepadiformis TaxID=159417 RepID=A0ABP0FRW9_CLALP
MNKKCRVRSVPFPRNLMSLCLIILLTTIISISFHMTFFQLQCKCHPSAVFRENFAEISNNNDDDQKEKFGSEDTLEHTYRLRTMKEIRKHLTNMWKAVNFELSSFKNVENNASSVDEAIIRLRERYLHLLAYIEVELEVETEQVVKDASTAKALVQTELQELQNPQDCSEAFYLKVESATCGFGCAMQHLLSRFTFAIGDQRVLVVQNPTNFYGIHDMNEIFESPSPTCSHFEVDQWQDFQSDEQSHNERFLLIKEDDEVRTRFIPQLVPEHIFDLVQRFHNYPYVWWSGQLLSYLMRAKPAVMVETDAVDFPFQKPTVGVHVRRTDKIYLEGENAAFHHLRDYMSHVEDWFLKEETKLALKSENNPKLKRRVYLATDDPMVWKEAKRYYPSYKFLGSVERSKRAKNLRTRDTRKGLIDIIADIYSLSQSNYIVCTLTSEVCKVAYQIMQTHNVDASADIYSLDFPFYFDVQAPMMRLVTLNHVAKESTNEIELKVGDQIDVQVDNHNGYFTGKNARTGETGMYPSYKVENLRSTFKYAKRN